MHLRRALSIVLAGALALAATACSDGGDGQDAFCDSASDTESFRAIFDDFDPADVPSAVEAFREARETEIELRREAPEAIRADIDLLVQFLDRLVEGLESVDPESTERPPIYDEIRTRFDQVEAASDRIETYVTANCDTTSTTAG